MAGRVRKGTVRNRKQSRSLPTRIDPIGVARQQGAKPIKGYAKMLKEFRDLWPDAEEIDDFVSWVRQTRQASGD